MSPRCNHRSLRTAAAFAAFAALLAAAGLRAQPTVNVGDLPPGKKVVVKFRATVNGLAPGLAPAALSNQGTVTGDGALTVVTDDPDTGAAGDATLTPLDSLAVGGLVWKEQGGNSVYDAGTDTLVVGAAVNLFLDDGDGVLDAGDGAAIASGATNGSGAYLFAGLGPGDYLVEIAAANFAAAGVLENFLPLPGAVDPDDDVKNDNNGLPVGASVASQAVTLAFGSEPTSDGDGDADTNLSVDFGFTDLADVEIVSKADSPDPVNAGDNLTYTVSFRNNGPVSAQNVTVTDSTPAGTTFVSASVTSGSGWGTSSPPVGGTGSVVFSKSSVALNETATFQLVVKVSSSQLAGAMVSNTATAAATTTDTTPGNDSKTATTTVQRDADLAIDKSDSGADAVAGMSYVYTLKVTNNGPSDSAGGTVTDTLPAGWSFSSSTNGTCAGDGGDPEEVTCTVSSLVAGGMSSFTLTADLSSGAALGTQTNSAAVAGDDPDSNAANDSDTEPTDVVAQADLQIGKTDDVDPVAPGGTLVYTVRVDNNGPSDAQNVVVTDTLPGSVTLTSTSGCAEDPNGVPTCSLGTVAAGAFQEYTVTVTVDTPVAAGLSSILNQVSVTSDAADTVPGNDSASESTAIDAAPDLAIDKTDGGISGFPGAVIVYTLEYDNVGNQDATGVTITDTVPAHTTFHAASSTAGWSCADGDPAGTVCTFSLGSLPVLSPVTSGFVAGTSESAQAITLAAKGPRPAGTLAGSVQFAVQVDPAVQLGTVREIDNSASIADDGANGADPDAANNSDNEITPLPVDFGDAPDPLVATPGLYPTLLASDGARHAIAGGLFLGLAVDDEADGQPTGAADGDDADGTDDEDGVVFVNGLSIGATSDLTVTATAPGLLNAWVDFNGNGSWAEPGEQVLTDQPVVAGANALSFAVPAAAVAGPTFARFRLSTAGGLSFDGQANDGEVEDYAVQILTEADLEVSLAQSNDSPAGSGVVLYTLSVTNHGPAEALGVETQLTLPTGAAFLGHEPAALAGGEAGGTVTVQVGNVASGGAETVTVGARLDPRVEGARAVTAAVSGSQPDPVSGNDTAQVTTTVVRNRVMAAAEFLDASGPRRVLGVSLEGGDETIALSMHEASDGVNEGLHLSGLGYRPVAITALDDISGIAAIAGTSAPEFAVAAHGFDGSVRVTVVDSDSEETLAEHDLAGAGAGLTPIDLAALPSFDGSVADELAVLTAGSVRVIVIDAAVGTVVRDHAVAAVGYPLFLAVVPDFGGTLTPELAIASRNPATGEVVVHVIDGNSGAVLGAHSLGTGLFPLGLAAIADLGPDAAAELALLARKADDGTLPATVFDAGTGAVLSVVQFAPALVPGSMVAVPNFDATAADELAVSGRDGAAVRVEERDAVSGALVGGHSVTVPPAIPVPLALEALSDFSGSSAAELALLYQFLATPTLVDVFDALDGGPPPVLTFVVP